MTRINDQHYINRVRKGDVNSFAYLVNTYKDLVFSLSYKMTKSREDAEEITQDTFIKAYKNLSKFKGDSKFSTWLYRIAYHTCLDAIKKNKKQYNTVKINEITINQIQSVDTVLGSLEKKERSKIMNDCILKLPEEEGLLILMFYYDELSLKEIIKITNLTEANIKVKLHRARKRLLSVIEKNVEPEIINHYGRK